MNFGDKNNKKFPTASSQIRDIHSDGDNTCPVTPKRQSISSTGPLSKFTPVPVIDLPMTPRVFRIKLKRLWILIIRDKVVHLLQDFWMKVPQKKGLKDFHNFDVWLILRF